ncbi:hypothetical protein [Roseibacillus persicicus]|uniref:hypothetical protein n=1 Tax=Roseibacillus persicicus TaxID=454148 RepID=UPI00280FC49C|nr:hypothetical protein [Roseibacillus persicicus]MDQ8190518.1 hypothetical protein [Roseibacillus persicicus]
MNSTNILLGSTGFLLVVALLFSITKMNQGKNEDPGQIAALMREVERLEAEQAQLKQKAPSSLIFTTSPYQPAPVEVKSDDTAKTLASIQEEMSRMRVDMENARPAAEEMVLTELDEVEDELLEEELAEEADPYAERRARMIRNALLQATVQGWDPEYWTISLDPAARANFNVGDELAVRRNDGILCTFVVSSQVGSQYIADLKSNLATGAPEIVPGDELIIPPAYDGQLD